VKGRSDTALAARFDSWVAYHAARARLDGYRAFTRSDMGSSPWGGTN